MNAIDEIRHLTSLAKLYLLQEHPTLRFEHVLSQAQIKPTADEQIIKTQPIPAANFQVNKPPEIKPLQSPVIQNRPQQAPVLKNTPVIEPVKAAPKVSDEELRPPATSIEATKWASILKEKFPNQVVLPQATQEKPAVQNFQNLVLFCPPPLSSEEVEMLKRLFKAISDQLSPATITSVLDPGDQRLNTVKLLLLPQTRLHEFSHLNMQKIALNPIHEYLQNNALKASLWKELTLTWQKLST